MRLLSGWLAAVVLSGLMTSSAAAALEPSAEVLYQTGLEAYSLDQYPQAAEAFLSLLQQYPDASQCRSAAYLLTVLLTDKVAAEQLAGLLDGLPQLDAGYRRAVLAYRQGQREEAAAEAVQLLAAADDRPTAALLAKELLMLMSDLAAQPYVKRWQRYIAHAGQIAVDAEDRVWVLVVKPPTLIRLNAHGEPDRSVTVHPPGDLLLADNLLEQSFAVFSDGSFSIGNARFAPNGRVKFRYPFRYATDVAVGPNDSLYVVYEHDGLGKYDRDGRLVYQVGPRGTQTGQLVYPTGVGANADLVVVTDRVLQGAPGDEHYRLQGFGHDGNVRWAVGRGADRRWPSRGWAPWDVELDRRGTIYTADSNGPITIAGPDVHELATIAQSVAEVHIDSRGTVYCRDEETVFAYLPLQQYLPRQNSP